MPHDDSPARLKTDQQTNDRLYTLLSLAHDAYNAHSRAIQDIPYAMSVDQAELDEANVAIDQITTLAAKFPTAANPDKDSAS